jgi:hypothetical protein
MAFAVHVNQVRERVALDRRPTKTESFCRLQTGSNHSRRKIYPFAQRKRSPSERTNCLKSPAFARNPGICEEKAEVLLSITLIQSLRLEPFKLERVKRSVEVPVRVLNLSVV